MRTISDHENTYADIKNIKTELDALKQTVKALLSIKEESKILNNHVRDTKKDIEALITANKITADKIGELEEECGYDTEEDLKTPNEKDPFVEDNIFEDFEVMYQIESVGGELLYVCNVCDEGFNFKGDVKTHLDINHTKILKNIRKESEAHLENQVQEKMSSNESKCDGEKQRIREPYTCKACSVYGNLIFISSNDKEIDEHILQYIERSSKPTNVEEIEEEEKLDDSDIYAGFDEYGNRIEEFDGE